MREPVQRVSVYVFLIMLLVLASFSLPAVPVLMGKDKEPVVESVPLTWSSDYVVQGNTVSLNSSDLEISVTPHTSSGGWVYVSFNAKKFAKSSTSLVDLLFGFTESGISVSKFELYDPYSVRDDFNESIGAEFYDENSNFSLGFTGNYLTFYEKDAKGVRQAIKGVTFDKYGSYDYNASLTFGWYTYHSYHVEEYRKFNEKNYEKTSFKIVGEAERWVSVPMKADSKTKSWNARFWLDVVPTTEIHVGEYWVGVKSSNESLTDALKFKHFTAIDPWYDATFPYKIKLTIDATKIDADLVDFPAAVFYDAGNMNWSNVQDDCDDFRFVDESGTPVLLKAELESYVVNTNSVIHCKVPAVDDTVNTDFYCYFGNPTAAAAWDAEGVWNANYVMVQHMVDSPDTSHIMDSTSNNNDGTKKGANEPILTASGQINNAQLFDGSDDKINCGTGANPTTNDFTVSVWVNFTVSDSTDRIIVSNRQSSNPWTGFMLLKQSSNHKTHIQVNDQVNYHIWWNLGVTVLDDGVYHYVTLIVNRVTNKLNLYVDLNHDITDLDCSEISGSIGSTASLYLGGESTSASMKGTEDELRLSNIARVPAWFKAEFWSGSDGLLTYGAEEEALPPTVGEFSTDAIVYPSKSTFLNVTARYVLGRTSIKNVMLTLEGGVIVGWNESDKIFWEVADPNNYFTLGTGTYVEVNATSYQVCFQGTFASSYPEGYKTGDADVFTDDDLTASAAEADWFLFTAPPPDFTWILALLIAIAAFALILLFAKK